MQLPGRLFLVILLGYALFAQGTVRSQDGATMLAVTRSLVRQHSTAIADVPGTRTGRDGREYSRYGIGTSIAAVPWFEKKGEKSSALQT